MATVTYPNGVQSTFTYDTLNRVTGLSSQVSGYTYQRGPTGNLTSATEPSGRTADWSYDGIYRLTNETIACDPSGKNGSVSYGLDPVGNRLSNLRHSAGMSSGSFSFNADDEVSSRDLRPERQRAQLRAARPSAYDSENHLVSMNCAGPWRMVYDAFGNRVSKTVNGVTTQVSRRRRREPDRLPAGLRGAERAVQSRAPTPTACSESAKNQIISSTWTPSFYGYDGGGNVRQLTNSAGAVTDSYEYDAFGN